MLVSPQLLNLFLQNMNNAWRLMLNNVMLLNPQFTPHPNLFFVGMKRFDNFEVRPIYQWQTTILQCAEISWHFFQHSYEGPA